MLLLRPMDLVPALLLENKGGEANFDHSNKTRRYCRGSNIMQSDGGRDF